MDKNKVLDFFDYLKNDKESAEKFKTITTLIGKPIIKADKTQSHIQYLLCDGSRVFKKDTAFDSTLLKGEIFLSKKKIQNFSVKND